MTATRTFIFLVICAQTFASGDIYDSQALDGSAISKFNFLVKGHKEKAQKFQEMVDELMKSGQEPANTGSGLVDNSEPVAPRSAKAIFEKLKKDLTATAKNIFKGFDTNASIEQFVGPTKEATRALATAEINQKFDRYLDLVSPTIKHQLIQMLLVDDDDTMVKNQAPDVNTLMLDPASSIARVAYKLFDLEEYPIDVTELPPKKSPESQGIFSKFWAWLCRIFGSDPDNDSKNKIPSDRYSEVTDKINQRLEDRLRKQDNFLHDFEKLDDVIFAMYPNLLIQVRRLTRLPKIPPTHEEKSYYEFAWNQIKENIENWFIWFPIVAKLHKSEFDFRDRSFGVYQLPEFLAEQFHFAIPDNYDFRLMVDRNWRKVYWRGFWKFAQVLADNDQGVALRMVHYFLISRSAKQPTMDSQARVKIIEKLINHLPPVNKNQKAEEFGEHALMAAIALLVPDNSSLPRIPDLGQRLAAIGNTELGTRSFLKTAMDTKLTFASVLLNPKGYNLPDFRKIIQAKNTEQEIENERNVYFSSQGFNLKLDELLTENTSENKLIQNYILLKFLLVWSANTPQECDNIFFRVPREESLYETWAKNLEEADPKRKIIAFLGSLNNGDPNRKTVDVIKGLVGGRLTWLKAREFEPELAQLFDVPKSGANNIIL